MRMCTAAQHGDAKYALAATHLHLSLHKHLTGQCHVLDTVVEPVVCSKYIFARACNARDHKYALLFQTLPVTLDVEQLHDDTLAS